METRSCSRRCMPSLRSKATQRRRKNVQGSGHGEWALSAAWRQKHRAAHAGRARTVATGSPRAWLLHGGSESRTGRGASHNARASIAPAGSGRSDGVTGSWADLRPGRFRRICGQGVNRLFVLRWLAAFCRLPKSLSYSASFSNDCPNNGHFTNSAGRPSGSHVPTPCRPPAHRQGVGMPGRLSGLMSSRYR